MGIPKLYFRIEGVAKNIFVDLAVFEGLRSNFPSFAALETSLKID